MNQLVAQVVALNRFAREGQHLTESWASTDFRLTFKAAVAACALEHTMGVEVSWSPNRPDILYVRREGIISGRTEFSRELPIDGELGKTFVSELRALAIKASVVEIQLERDQALQREAGDRVTALMQNAAPATATSA